MKKLVILIVVLLCVSFTIFAADFETPHRFKAGDIISADMLNEVLDYIDASKRTIVPEDIVGNWKCTKYGSNNSIAHKGYNVSTGQTYIYYDNIDLIITKNENGLNWSSTPINAITFSTWNDNCSGYGKLETIEGDFFYSRNMCDQSTTTETFRTDITKISNSRIRFQIVETCLVCDLQNLPPAIPADLEAEGSGREIRLSWKDASSDETGFKIIRKDRIDGEWTEVASVEENALSYVDTVDTGASYWYRVQSFNENGDSLGSNVVKVDM